MNLVDSSGWLEYFSGSKNAKYFAPAIENTNELVVSVINIYEVFKKVLIERDEKSAIEAAGIMQQAFVVDINPELALWAAIVSSEYKLPMADSLIYATALKNNAIIWTQDKDFKNLENVKYIKK